MTSGFHASELLKSVSNYPVAKGDVVGHPFHGNQYTEGSGGSDWAARRAKVLAEGVHVAGVPNAVEHNRLAADHTALAEKLRREGHDDVANAHDAAARQHNLASAAHARLAVIENRGRARGNGPTMSKALKEARDRASVAAGVSQRADVFTREINK